MVCGGQWEVWRLLPASAVQAERPAGTGGSAWAQTVEGRHQGPRGPDAAVQDALQPAGRGEGRGGLFVMLSIAEFSHTLPPCCPLVVETLSLPQVPQLEVFPRPGPVGAYRPPEAQLGLLSCFLRDGWLVSWNEYSVYVVDWVNEVGEHLSPQSSSHQAAGSVSCSRVVSLCWWFWMILVGVDVAPVVRRCAVCCRGCIQLCDSSCRCWLELWRAAETLCRCRAVTTRSSS